jgi:hypothetical protein
MIKDVRIRGYSSNPKEVREQKSLDNTKLEYNIRYGKKHCGKHLENPNHSKSFGIFFTTGC